MPLAPGARNPFSGRTYIVCKCRLKGRWQVLVEYDGHDAHRLDYFGGKAIALAHARLLAGRSYPVEVR